MKVIFFLFLVLLWGCSNKDQPSNPNHYIPEEPQVKFFNITPGQLIVDSITVLIDASDNKGITKIEFYVDAAIHSTVFTKPYNVLWTSTNDRSKHAIYAKAYDADGNTNTTNVFEVDFVKLNKPHIYSTYASEDSISVDWNYTGRKDNYELTLSVKKENGDEANIFYIASNERLTINDDSLNDFYDYSVKVLPIYKSVKGILSDYLKLLFEYTPKIINVIAPDTVENTNTATVYILAEIKNRDGLNLIDSVYYIVTTPNQNMGMGLAEMLFLKKENINLNL